ncbi:MAG TPA: hypothetical protein VFE15_14910 [Marmoricola sp.]|jgi:hypothetical protein|nr:hypothetical protein [Marmoricola sp.]
MSNGAIERLDVGDFWKKGYAVLPGVFTSQEIQSFRDGANATAKDGGDLLSNPQLHTVLTDGRLVQVARKLLGTDVIHYGGDSSFTINGTQRGFHKDNTDRQDGDAPDWTQGRYTQLRFGIYCQDHTKHTGGLNLREGSHEVCNLTEGENRYVKVKPGDLAVWSMRISHSGNGMLLRWPFTEVPLPNQHDKYPSWKVTKADGDRIAIFAHLGADDTHAKRYGDYLKTRTYMVNIWRKGGLYKDEVLAEAAAAGLKVRDMPAEIMDDPEAGQNAQWQAFPY